MTIGVYSGGVPLIDNAIANLGYTVYGLTILPPAVSAPQITSPSGLPAAPPPVHAQFSPSTIGTVTMLAYGRCRLPGQFIWALGLDATSNALDTSTLTCAISFCEPIDPAETFIIQNMSANGTPFYDLDQGGVIEVANMTGDQIAQLRTCIAGMAVYTGAEDQLADPTMIAALGAGNVPAYRGLRYIVLQDFPLAISNNAVPNISVEFRPASGGPLFNVADIMVLLATRRGINLQVDGVADQGYGLVISDQSSFIGHLQQEKDVFSYQIVDGDPIRVVRRPVDGGLVIDLELAEADCVRRGGPALAFDDADDSDLAAGCDLRYTDVDHAFDIKVAQAAYEASTTSTAIAAPQTNYIMDATTARELSFDIMFQQRAKGNRATLEVDDARLEVSDVINLTTREGDGYALLVDQQTLTKSRSSQINAIVLLTSVGNGIAGDGGHDGGSLARRLWPEQSINFALAVTADRIWGTYNGIITYNSTTTPRRKISTWTDLSADDLGGTNWSVSGAPGQVLLDASYVYFIANNMAVITRIPLGGTMSQRQTLVISDGFGSTGSVGSFSTGANSISNARIFEGKLYIPWAGKWAGVANQMKLVVIDLVAWSPSAFTVHDYSTDAILKPGAWGMCITDNGVITISTQINGGVPVGRIYYATVAVPGSWAHVDMTILGGFGVSSGNIAYFLEGPNGQGTTHRKTHAAIVDCSSGTPSVSIVDLTSGDADFINISQAGESNSVFPWISETHLFIPANFTRNNTTDQAEASKYYIAKRDLGTLAVATGALMGELIYNGRELQVENAAFFEGQHYMVAYATDFSYDGRLLIADDALAAATLYPRPTYSVPSNNNFGAALAIHVGDTVSGNLFYGSTEASEPLPSWAASGSLAWVLNNGHSVWYKFTAPSTASFTFSLSDLSGSDNFSIQIYTGSDLASLVEVATHNSTGAGSPGTLVLSATSATDYSISIRRDIITFSPEESGGLYTLSLS